MGEHAGVLRRTVSRLATSAKVHEAEELQKGCFEVGATPVVDLPRRERVTVAGDGTVRQVRHQLPEQRPGTKLSREQARTLFDRMAL